MQRVPMMDQNYCFRVWDIIFATSGGIKAVITGMIAGGLSFWNAIRLQHLAVITDSWKCRSDILCFSGHLDCTIVDTDGLYFVVWNETLTVEKKVLHFRITINHFRKALM